MSVLVNSLGATPPEELYILYRMVKARLDALGAAIVMPLVGRYATSMEMAGVSFTLIRLDDELEGLLRRPATAPSGACGDASTAPRLLPAIDRLRAAMEREASTASTPPTARSATATSASR